MFVLIAYDIEEDKLRTRVARFLEGRGERVQYSVFECHLTPGQYKETQAGIEDLVARARRRWKKTGVDPTSVSVRFYRLCAACSRRVEIVGSGSITPNPMYFMV